MSCCKRQFRGHLPKQRCARLLSLSLSSLPVPHTQTPLQALIQLEYLQETLLLSEAATFQQVLIMKIIPIVVLVCHPTIALPGPNSDLSGHTGPIASVFCVTVVRLPPGSFLSCERCLVSFTVSAQGSLLWPHRVPRT